MKIVAVLLIAFSIGVLSIAFSIIIADDTDLSWRVFLSSLFGAIGGETIGAIAVLGLFGWFFQRRNETSNLIKRKHDIRSRLFSLLATNNTDNIIEAVNLAKATGLLYDGTLKNSNFDNISFKNQRLDGADFEGCSFVNSDLSNALMSSSNLKRAIMTNTNVDSAVFYGADMFEAEISEEQLDTAETIDQAILPSGIVFVEQV